MFCYKKNSILYIPFGTPYKTPRKKVLPAIFGVEAIFWSLWRYYRAHFRKQIPGTNLFTDLATICYCPLTKRLEQLFQALLTTKPTSVGSERSFSAGGSFCTKIRSRMNDNTLSALISLKQYFKHREQKLCLLVVMDISFVKTNCFAWINTSV